MNENQDLIDLCRLQLMEDHIGEADTKEKETELKAIDWKSRQLSKKIISASEEGNNE